MPSFISQISGSSGELLTQTSRVKYILVGYVASANVSLVDGDSNLLVYLPAGAANLKASIDLGTNSINLSGAGNVTLYYAAIRSDVVVAPEAFPNALLLEDGTPIFLEVGVEQELLKESA